MSSGISFFYGHTEWGRNDGLTEALFTRLGDVVRRRVEESGDEGLWRGGIFVDTPAEFAKKDKHAMITRCVREFESEPSCECERGRAKLKVNCSQRLACRWQ